MQIVETRNATAEVVVHGYAIDLTDAPPARRDARADAVLLPSRAGGPAGVGAVLKRALDIVVAAVVLLLVLPTMLVAALGVKLASPGPALFRQERVGRNGRRFTMYKFRTYPVDHVDAAVALPTECCPIRFGRVLRRTSIDELPQLLNVLLGHMSLVGPRPERPRFALELAHELPGYVERLRAPAGLTGLAQIRDLHGTSSLRARVDADNEYIEGWSFGSDLRILVLTVPTVFRKARGVFG